jgi:hypothetical protein
MYKIFNFIFLFLLRFFTVATLFTAFSATISYSLFTTFSATLKQRSTNYVYKDFP